MTAGPRPSAVVLAGGRSTRFGSDKLTADVRGRPLLFRAIDAVAEVCCEVVLVVGADDVPALPAGLGVPLRIVRDATPGGGPLVGLLAGLEEGASPKVIVVGGDMPAIVPALLTEMDRRLGEQPGVDAVALLDGDRPRPLPCVVRREPALRSARALLAAGRSRLRDLLEALNVEPIPDAEWRRIDPTGRSLLDVDRPEDLAAFEVG